MLQIFLPFAEVAVAALIVSLVIHEDPLVDARAFWLTRPIPRGQLFLAKLITIALVIFAPALAALAVLLAWYHVPPVYMMRAGFEVVLWLALPLLLLTVAATFTSTLPRYLMLLVGVIVAGPDRPRPDGDVPARRRCACSSRGCRASPIPRESSPSRPS